MNYKTITKDIEHHILETSTNLGLSGDKYVGVYTRKINNLRKLVPINSHLMFIAYKSTMVSMASNYVLEQSVNKKLFMQCFPYSRFREVYQSVGRHDII